MTDPYTYTDVDGDRLAVFGADIPDKGKGFNVRTDPNGCSVPAEDAAAFVRAVLAAGDTGHVVMSTYALDQMILNWRRAEAQNMRRRVLQVIEAFPYTDRMADEVRALPLLPDTEVAHEGVSQPASETPSEQPARSDYDTEFAALLAKEDAARSMCERALKALDAAPDGTDLESLFRSLPLLPDDEPKKSGRVESLEIDGKQVYPKTDLDQHATRDIATALPLLPDEAEATDTAPVEGFDAGWTAGHTHARADEARITELEKQVADLSDLVHGHGEDIGQAKAAIQGLGSQRTAPRRGSKFTPDTDH